MDISIVIPAKNEEKYLPRLLRSIEKQSLKPRDIIVVDADSEDNTRKVARKHGAKVVKGGAHPSISRNMGAKIATGELIYFLDADTWMPDNFLKNTCEEIIERDIDLAVPDNFPVYTESEKGYNSKLIRLYDKMLYTLDNGGTRFWSHFYPVGTGTCIICKKKLFDKIGGFTESIVVFEDSNLVFRGSKKSKFRVLDSNYIGVSTRRFDEKGRFWFPLYMGIRGSIGRLLFGESHKTDYFD